VKTILRIKTLLVILCFYQTVLLGQDFSRRYGANSHTNNIPLYLNTHDKKNNTTASTIIHDINHKRKQEIKNQQQLHKEQVALQKQKERELKAEQRRKEQEQKRLQLEQEKLQREQEKKAQRLPAAAQS